MAEVVQSIVETDVENTPSSAAVYIELSKKASLDKSNTFTSANYFPDSVLSGPINNNDRIPINVRSFKAFLPSLIETIKLDILALITDAIADDVLSRLNTSSLQPLNANLTSISALTTSGFVYRVSNTVWQTKTLVFDQTLFSNVDTTDKTNKTYLGWETNKWVAKEIKLNDLSDVTISLLANDKVLVWDSASTQWKPKAFTLDTLADVNLTLTSFPKVPGCTLVWTATADGNPVNQWLPRRLMLDWLEDVVSPSSAARSHDAVLRWNSSTLKWAPSLISLDTLSDVSMVDPDYPVGTTQRLILSRILGRGWRPVTLTLDDISDVQINKTTAHNGGHYLKYVPGPDVGLGKWVNSALPLIPAVLDQLDDVNLTGLSGDDAGKYLKYNGSAWVAATAVTSLDSLTDVNAPAPSDGQYLKYNGTTSKWIAAAVSSGASSNTVSKNYTLGSGGYATIVAIGAQADIDTVTFTASNGSNTFSVGNVPGNLTLKSINIVVPDNFIGAAATSYTIYYPEPFSQTSLNTSVLPAVVSKYGTTNVSMPLTNINISNTSGTMAVNQTGLTAGQGFKLHLEVI